MWGVNKNVGAAQLCVAGILKALRSAGRRPLCSTSLLCRDPGLDPGQPSKCVPGLLGTGVHTVGEDKPGAILGSEGCGGSWAPCERLRLCAG